MNELSARSQERRLLCISLIGMPGAGKSTLGKLAAQKLGWAFIDTDYLLEGWYGLPLEDLRNFLGQKKFLQAEEKILVNLDLNRCIIATGGSVVYSLPAMHKLQDIGLIVYLQADYKSVLQRISSKPRRGLILPPGQNLEDLYLERTSLYRQYADLTLSTDYFNINQCLQILTKWIYEKINFE